MSSIKFSKGTKEENIKYYSLSVLLVILGLLVYFYLYNQQRDIDNNLGTTNGKIIEYKVYVVQSGWEVKYEYYVFGKKYEDFGAIGKYKIKIDLSKDYVVEYSTKDPSISRIIINGKKYSKGVD